ncbi:hypothetical protein llap_1876 [Limosa lapponica baueri]|uniref:Uncharacterized protein n=1 Tax=Limosa lapponica baueri TaxID=1758121 RepID=A0A2I0UP78_LIMLA|nr:hypothetical protein llap_1876 [Limosa lapponica baueri]
MPTLDLFWLRLERDWGMAAARASYVGPEKPHPTVSPLAFEYKYVMQETVGQSKPRLKPLSSKLNSSTPTKPQVHQKAATDLQAVAQYLLRGVTTQKGQEAVPLPDLTWSDHSSKSEIRAREKKQWITQESAYPPRGEERRGEERRGEERRGEERRGEEKKEKRKKKKGKKNRKKLLCHCSNSESRGQKPHISERQKTNRAAEEGTTRSGFSESRACMPGTEIKDQLTQSTGRISASDVSCFKDYRPSCFWCQDKLDRQLIHHRDSTTTVKG